MKFTTCVRCVPSLVSKRFLKSEASMSTEGEPAAAGAAPATEESAVAAPKTTEAAPDSAPEAAPEAAAAPEATAAPKAEPEAAAAPKAAAATPAAAPVPTAGDGSAEAAAAAPLAAAASLFGSKGGLGKQGSMSKLKDIGKKVVLAKKMSVTASVMSKSATAARFTEEMKACTPERFDSVPAVDEETVRLLSEKMNQQIPKVIVDPAARGFFNLFRRMDHDGSGNIAFGEFAEMVCKGP